MRLSRENSNGGECRGREAREKSTAKKRTSEDASSRTSVVLTYAETDDTLKEQKHLFLSYSATTTATFHRKQASASQTVGKKSDVFEEGTSL